MAYSILVANDSTLHGKLRRQSLAALTNAIECIVGNCSNKKSTISALAIYWCIDFSAAIT